MLGNSRKMKIFKKTVKFYSSVKNIFRNKFLRTCARSLMKTMKHERC